MSKNKALDIQNVHATSEAADAIMKLFYRKLNIQSLNWQTAADVAELIGPHNFNLPTYKQLLKQIHEQFDLECANDLLEIAKALGDEEGIKEYEHSLLLFLKDLDKNDHKTFQIIANLVKGHGLKTPIVTGKTSKGEKITTTLQAEIDKIEKAKTKRIIKQQIDEQNLEDEALTQQMLDEIEKERNEASYSSWTIPGLSWIKKPTKKK